MEFTILETTNVVKITKILSTKFYSKSYIETNGKLKRNILKCVTFLLLMKSFWRIYNILNDLRKSKSSSTVDWWNVQHFKWCPHKNIKFCSRLMKILTLWIYFFFKKWQTCHFLIPKKKNNNNNSVILSHFLHIIINHPCDSLEFCIRIHTGEKQYGCEHRYKYSLKMLI